jgi:hypothetical protein
MEKELEDTEVYKYEAVLAEAFGERKIFAHRAIGLESLLCQFMHQMLAKQHQVKIIKKLSKDIQQHYKKHRLQNKDEFHSYEALAFQTEASRLTLVSLYDDIFADQHRILAQLTNVKNEGGNMTNYSIAKPKKLEKPKPSLRVTAKHDVSAVDLGTPTNLSDAGENDYEAAMDILSNHDEEDALFQPVELEARTPKVDRDAMTGSRRRSPEEDKPSSSSKPSSTRPRERRREIEHLRNARVVGGSRNVPSPTAAELLLESPPARDRMRKLEAVRLSISSSGEGSPTKDNNETSKGADAKNTSPAKERTPSKGKSSSRSERRSTSRGSNESTDSTDEKRRERREQRRRAKKIESSSPPAEIAVQDF